MVLKVSIAELSALAIKDGVTQLDLVKSHT